MTEPRLKKLARSATEAELLAFVRDAAAWGGWLCYHTHDSRRSPEGFPDIVAVHPDLGRLVFAELKDAKRKATADQERWLAALAKISTRMASKGDGRFTHPHPEVYLWRPADADEIVSVFLGHRRWRYHPGEVAGAVASTATVDRPGRS